MTCEAKVTEPAVRGSSFMGSTSHPCSRRASVNVFDRGVLVATMCRQHALAKFDPDTYQHRPV
jgi:hypothetical protein